MSAEVVNVEFRFDEALPVLRRTPGALRELLLELPTAWTHATEGPGERLQTFDAPRKESLDRLSALGLTDTDLARRGRHPEFGVVTMAQHLATWLAHDLDHVGQIVRVMAHQYADAVGPWKAYLSILGRD